MGGIDPDKTGFMSAAAMPVRLHTTRLAARFYMVFAGDFLLSNRLPSNPPLEIKTCRKLSTHGVWGKQNVQIIHF